MSRMAFSGGKNIHLQDIRNSTEEDAQALQIH